MTGERNLPTLLRNMRPTLHGEAFGFFSLAEAVAVPLLPEARGSFREDEGLTLILPLETARVHGLKPEAPWALITLTVHSSLSAVGFLAAISAALAAAGISLNAVSAYYHDHLFVPWDRRLEALAILERLAGASPN
ncbi:MAG: ACT domain-containing protein [Holophagaceae bacterium]|nr:ACT domain-containing protein [Holophagaceae bacterium]